MVYQLIDGLIGFGCLLAIGFAFLLLLGGLFVGGEVSVLSALGLIGLIGLLAWMYRHR